MNPRPEMPLAVSLVLVTAAFAVITGALPLALSVDELPRSVETLQGLGRPYGFVYVNLALRVAEFVLAIATFFIVLRKLPQVSARWGLALHAAMLFMAFWWAGSAMRALEMFPIRLSWLIVVGILLLPLRRFRDEWDAEPPNTPGVRLRIPMVTVVLLTVMFVMTAIVVLFLGGWMLGGS